MMTERETAEMKKLLEEMPKASLVQLKRLINAELDARPSKRVVFPQTAWNDLMTRNNG